jgi:hypothetical protein
MPITYEASPALPPLAPGGVDALAELRELLRRPEPRAQRLYHDIELALQRLQRGREGPLTTALQAWVGREDELPHSME